MSRDGPGKLNLSERLKAKSAQELRDQEDVIQHELDRHAESLRQSSTAALRRIETSINDQITQIEIEVRDRRISLRNEMDEIKSEPARLMWKSALIGAVIGSLITLIPWGVMSYLGISVTGEARGFFERARTIKAEEARIATLESVEILTIEGEKILMLPATVTQIFQCGTERTPCIKLEE